MAKAASPKRKRRPTQFRKAVEEVGAPVRDAYRPGLQALGRSHSHLVSCADSKRLTGSIDLDAALRESQPSAPRWDYGIGYRHQNGEYAVWVEVHGVQANKVREMLGKLAWLKDWLDADGRPLRRMTTAKGAVPAFVWLASGRLNLPRNSRQARQASPAGIFPRKRLDIP